MKLLIVDDEVDLCALLRDHFGEHFEGEVFTATTPGEALRLLEQLQPEGMFSLAFKFNVSAFLDRKSVV